MALAELLNDGTKQSFVGGELHIRNESTHYDLKGRIKDIVLAGHGIDVVLSSVTIRFNDRPRPTGPDDLLQPICQNELRSVERLASGNGVKVVWNAHLTAELLMPHKALRNQG